MEMREVNRVGGRGPIPANFRLIVASNRDLKEMARTPKLGADLSRASRTCSREVACNHEQLALARKKSHPITSNWHLLERSRIPSRATDTCSKEVASNHEQLALARKKSHPITSN